MLCSLKQYHRLVLYEWLPQTQSVRVHIMCTRLKGYVCECHRAAPTTTGMCVFMSSYNGHD